MSIPTRDNGSETTGSLTSFETGNWGVSILQIPKLELSVEAAS